MSEDINDIVGLTADIAAAYVANNSISAADVAGLISSIHGALQQTANPAPIEVAKQEPAVSIRSSVKSDHIVCLEDGAKLKMLKRYLRTRFNMSPEDYRAKWGLPRDYPMVAPDYAETRKQLAHKIGLGRKRDAAPTPTASAKSTDDGAPKTAAKRGRKPKVAETVGADA